MCCYLLTNTKNEFRTAAAPHHVCPAPCGVGATFRSISCVLRYFRRFFVRAIPFAPLGEWSKKRLISHWFYRVFCSTRRVEQKHFIFYWFYKVFCPTRGVEQNITFSGFLLNPIIFCNCSRHGIVKSMISLVKSWIFDNLGLRPPNV